MREQSGPRFFGQQCTFHSSSFSFLFQTQLYVQKIFLTVIDGMGEEGAYYKSFSAEYIHVELKAPAHVPVV